MQQPDSKTLPPGKTCGDCFWFTRCCVLFQQPAKAKVCDFSPSRFNGDDHEHFWRTSDGLTYKCAKCELVR